MKIGYILTTFPCRSETFAEREIKELGRIGFDISVLAATSQQYRQGLGAHTDIMYRPSLFSLETLYSLVHILHKYPFFPISLLQLIIRLIRTCIRDALLVLKNFHTIASFVRFLDCRKITHIHAYFLSWPATIALAISAITGRSFSISAHARDIFVEHGDIELKVSRSTFVTVCNRQGLDYLKAKLPKECLRKLHLNYHGIMSNFRCKREVKESGNNNMLIAIGRMIPKKGFDSLLKALAKVVKDGRSCKLILFGDGAKRQQLHILAQQLGIEDNVQLPGWVDSTVVLNYMRQASMLIVPSIVTGDGDSDGLPNVVLEAFASNTPIIASNLPGINDAIVHGETGLLVEPGDITALALEIERLLGDRQMQGHLARNAYEMSIQRFDLTKNVAQISTLFKGNCEQVGKR